MLLERNIHSLITQLLSASLFIVGSVFLFTTPEEGQYIHRWGSTLTHTSVVTIKAFAVLGGLFTSYHFLRISHLIFARKQVLEISADGCKIFEVNNDIIPWNSIEKIEVTHNLRKLEGELIATKLIFKFTVKSGLYQKSLDINNCEIAMSEIIRVIQSYDESVLS